MYDDYEQIAKKMLTLSKNDNLPKELERELEGVDNLCRHAGGKLITRQLIAYIIYKYLDKKYNSD
jgi:hypothetical protein